MQPSTPAAPAVRETLERLLASQTFGRSERARNLLRYLVEREQAGEAERLKGFSIAMDVFGKDADFDPSTDAVVRVQAGRLRDLLRQYFTTEGVADPLRITIPRGSYVPAYEPNAIGATAASGPPPAATSASGLSRQPADRAMSVPSMLRHFQFFWLAIAVVIAMLGLLIFRQGGSSEADGDKAVVETTVATSSIAAAAPIDALPRVYIEVKTHSAEADRVAATLRAGLSGFDTVDFIGRNAAAIDPAAGTTSFVFDIASGPAAGEITIELQNAATGEVLLSRSLDTADTEPTVIEDRVAGLLSATVPASGTIYGYIEQNGIQSGLTECLLLDDEYYLDQNDRTHRAAYGCLERLVRQDARSPLIYSELAALHLEAITDHYAYPPGATMEQAKAFAQRAMQMGATSPYAHRTYGYLNARLGNSEESIRWMRKAYELNTYDLSMAAAYGYGLIFAGRYSEGTPIVARAVDASSAHPTWWDYGLFLGEFMLGDMARAARATGTLTTTKAKSHYLAARLIGARVAGDDKEAAELLRKLTGEFPEFAADPRRAFIDRRYPADMTERLVKALRAAGLGRAS